MFKYVPGQTKSSSVKPYTPGEKEATEVDRPDFIAPDLQELVDKAKAKMEQEQETPKSQSHMPTKEDWDWFAEERVRRLNAAGDASNMGRDMTLEERSQLYQYRQALFELSSKLPSNWTRESIVWPQKPVGV